MSLNSESFDLSGAWYRDDPRNSSPGVLEEISFAVTRNGWLDEEGDHSR